MFLNEFNAYCLKAVPFTCILEGPLLTDLEHHSFVIQGCYFFCLPTTPLDLKYLGIRCS